MTVNDTNAIELIPKGGTPCFQWFQCCWPTSSSLLSINDDDMLPPNDDYHDGKIDGHD